MGVFRSGNFVFGYRHMTLLWTMKIFDRKYTPASWNFQETDLFFVKIGLRGCNKKSVQKKFLNPSLYFAVVSFLEPRKVRVCESVKQILPLIFYSGRNWFLLWVILAHIFHTLLSEPRGFRPSRCTKIFLNSNCSSSYEEIYIIKAISRSHFLGTDKKIT